MPRVGLGALGLALPLFLLAALPALAAALARLDDRVSTTHDFASLPLHRAWQVHGKVARFRVKLISDVWTIRQWDAYECAGEEDRLYTVWLPEGQEVKNEMTVEAVLVVISPGLGGADGQAIPEPRRVPTDQGAAVPMNTTLPLPQAALAGLGLMAAGFSRRAADTRACPMPVSRTHRCSLLACRSMPA
jgi:hypothetical protein